MPAGHLIRGEQGERAAAEELVRRGYVILERNWRQKPGELDLICEQGGMVVFVEVKTRDARGLQRPHEALSRAKMGRLAQAASLYLSEKEMWERPCRFDLAEVSAGESGLSVHLIQDVLDVSALARPVGWQPW